MFSESEEKMEGMSVRFVGCSDLQASWTGNADPRKFLVIGDLYKISQASIHSTTTELELVEFPKKRFNSVCFNFLTEEGEISHLPL